MSKFSKIAFLFSGISLVSMSVTRYLLGDWVPFCWLALGLAVFFLVAGLFAQPFVSWIHNHQTFFTYYNIVVGILFLALGVLVFTGKLALIAGSFSFLNEALLR